MLLNRPSQRTKDFWPTNTGCLGVAKAVLQIRAVFTQSVKSVVGGVMTFVG
jgi:hypothetical protein